MYTYSTKNNRQRERERLLLSNYGEMQAGMDLKAWNFKIIKETGLLNCWNVVHQVKVVTWQ